MEKIEKWNKTSMRAQGAGRVRRGQGCCMLVIRSILWCVNLMDRRRTTKKATRTQPRWGQRQRRKSINRPQRGGGFWLNLDLCAWWFEVIWCMWYRKVTSRYIVTSCPASCDITRYGKSRHRIISTSRCFGTDMEISYPVDFFLDTEYYFLLIRCTKRLKKTVIRR